MTIIAQTGEFRIGNRTASREPGMLGIPKGEVAERTTAENGQKTGRESFRPNENDSRPGFRPTRRRHFVTWFQTHGRDTLANRWKPWKD